MGGLGTVPFRKCSFIQESDGKTSISFPRSLLREQNYFTTLLEVPSLMSVQTHTVYVVTESHMVQQQSPAAQYQQAPEAHTFLTSTEDLNKRKLPRGVAEEGRTEH